MRFGELRVCLPGCITPEMDSHILFLCEFCWHAEKPLATFSLTRWSGSQHACALYVPTETAFALDLAAGSIVQVALVDCTSGKPTNLIEKLNNKLKVSIGYQADTLGSYFVPAQVWPSSKVRSGCVGASDLLLSSLLCEEAADTTVGIYGPFISYQNIRECTADKISLEFYMQSSRNKSRTPGDAYSQTEDIELAETNPASQSRQRIEHRRYPTPRAARKGRKDFSSRRGETNFEDGSRQDEDVSKAASLLLEDRFESISREFSKVFTLLGKEFKSAELEQSTSQNFLSKYISSAGSLATLLRRALHTLVRQVVSDRHVLEGNFFQIPIAGSTIFFYTRHIESKKAQVATAVYIDRECQIEIMTDGDSEHSNMEEMLGLKAAKAAAGVLGVSLSDPAAIAASNAFLYGFRSLGCTLSDIGGLKAQVEALRRSVVRPFTSANELDNRRFSRGLIPAGLLLFGPPGTGKSALARATANDSKAAFFVVNGPDVVSENLGESESQLRGIFTAARALAPSLIFIDEIDSIAPSRTLQSAAAARLVTTLVSELDNNKNKGVVVIAATNRREAIDDSLRRPGRFDREIELGVPSPQDRLEILKRLTSLIEHEMLTEELCQLNESLHGFVGADLQSLCNEAALIALRRYIHDQRQSCPIVKWRDFVDARKCVCPSALREVVIETPNVSWSDIGGYDNIKQELKEVVEWPLKFGDRLLHFGARAPKGILLYGPPGCSKTLLARAVAKESSMNFISIKGPELINKYVGESEKAIRAVFRRARATSPCVVFFDEVDGLVHGTGVEDSRSSDVSNRVLSQLLQEIDSCQVSNDGVVVIAATNRPQNIDSALLRPGRLDRLLFVPTPDKAARLAILYIQTRDVPLGNDVDLKFLSEKCCRFTGAELAGLCQKAALLSLNETETAEFVGMKHFEMAFEEVYRLKIDDDAANGLYERFQRALSSNFDG